MKTKAIPRISLQPLRVSFLLFGLLLFAFVPLARSSHLSVPPPGRLSPYTGGAFFNLVRYQGKLACLRDHDVSEVPSKCSADELLLLVDGGTAARLTVTIPELRSKLTSASLDGRAVEIMGRYYETTNQILVFGLIEAP